MRFALAAADQAVGQGRLLAELVGRSRHDWSLLPSVADARAAGAAAVLAPADALAGPAGLPVVALAGPSAPLPAGRLRRRRALDRAVHVLATSPTALDRLPNGVSRELLRPGLGVLPAPPLPSWPREPLLLVAGPLCPAARAGVAVDALRLALAAGFRGRLVVAGPVAAVHRREVERLRERAAGLPVTVLPDPEPAVLHGLLASATALLAPALDDAEALTREALASGTPVLACAAGPDRSTVLHDRTGWLLAPDARAFAHQSLMLGVCTAQDLAPLRAACAASVAGSSWAAVVDRVDDVLELAGLGLPVAVPVRQLVPATDAVPRERLPR